MSSISAIIPAYNAEKFIGEAIESALNQTRPAKEIVVVDDASTDRTVKIARSFGDRVQVLVNEKNSGPGHSRNAGVAASTGDYLAFLDADDKWLPEHLKDLAGLLDKWPEAQVAVGAVRTFGCREYVRSYLPQATTPMNVFVPLMRSYGIWPTATMVRRKCFVAIGGYQDIPEFYKGRRFHPEDTDFILRLAIRFQVVTSSAVSAMYRRHPEQTTANREHHRLATFKTKMRIIENISALGGDSALGAEASDRMLREFEQHLKEARITLNLKKLRMFVRWGMKSALLRPACVPYLRSILLPQWFLRFRDEMRP